MIADRTRELAELDAFVSRAAGHGAGLCLVGDPGAGKTTLLDAAVGRARGRGLEVHRAAGALLEADLPGAVLHELLYPRTGDLITLVRPPALVVVDDLHWADDRSRAVLGRLADRIGGTRIGLLAASLDPPGRPLEALDVLEVESLDRAVAAAMVGAGGRAAAATSRLRNTAGAAPPVNRAAGPAGARGHGVVGGVGLEQQRRTGSRRPDLPVRLEQLALPALVAVLRPIEVGHLRPDDRAARTPEMSPADRAEQGGGGPPAADRPLN